MRRTLPIARSLNTSIDTTSSASTMAHDTANIASPPKVPLPARNDPSAQPAVVPRADAPRPMPKTRTGDTPVTCDTCASRHQTIMMKQV